MSVKFKYKNGFEGVVSDEVAKVLEKKGEGKIIGEAEKPAPKKEEKAKE